MDDIYSPSDNALVDARQDAIWMEFVKLMSDLHPASRLVFVLHDLWGVEMKEVSVISGLSGLECAELLVAARRRVRLRERMLLEKLW